MECDLERITGYVDGELPSRGVAEVERHLLLCVVCTAQGAGEAELRQRLRTLGGSRPEADWAPRAASLTRPETLTAPEGSPRNSWWPSDRGGLGGHSLAARFHHQPS